MEPVIIICVIVVVLFAAIMAILSRYRKCPSDKVLVIYGKVGTDKNGQARSARCIHGGAAFIVPIIQSYEYMDLTPISINVDLKNALSKQNIRKLSVKKLLQRLSMTLRSQLPKNTETVRSVRQTLRKTSVSKLLLQTLLLSTVRTKPR